MMNGEFYGHEKYRGNPRYATGWVWKCCGKPSNNKGWQKTRHKTKVNVPPTVEKTGKKRKSGEEAPAAAKRRD